MHSALRVKRTQSSQKVTMERLRRIKYLKVQRTENDKKRRYTSPSKCDWGIIFINIKASFNMRIIINENNTQLFGGILQY